MIIFAENELLYRIVQILMLVLGGIFILRFAGKKSISQMTFPTLVVSLAYGTLLIKPLKLENDVLMTLILISTIVFTLIVLEWLETKVKWFDDLINGKAIALVENGKLNQENMKKSRITLKQLEGMLREKSIDDYSNCDWVTLETNGKIGYKLKKEYRPITYNDIKTFKEELTRL